MIVDEIREDALRRLSHREYVDDGEWLEAVRTITRMEEDFKEQKSLLVGGASGVTQGEKRKFKDWKPTVNRKRVKKQYMAKEVADYKKEKAGERKVKKEGWVAPAGEIKNRVWAEAPEGVDQKVVNSGKSNNQCTQYTMRNHAWKYS